MGYEESMRVRTEILGPEHPAVAESLNNIALLMFAQGELEDANLLYSRSLFIKTNVFGEEHEIVASAMQSLASVLNAQGKKDEAAKLFNKSLSIRERILGEDHPDTLAVAEQIEKMTFKEALKYEKGLSDYPVSAPARPGGHIKGSDGEIGYATTTPVVANDSFFEHFDEVKQH